MKRWLIKIISFTLCVLTVFSFTACQNGEQPQNPTENSTVNVGAEPLSYEIKKENTKIHKEITQHP